MNFDDTIFIQIFSYIPCKVQLLFVSKRFHKLFSESLLIQSDYDIPIAETLMIDFSFEYVMHDVVNGRTTCELRQKYQSIEFDPDRSSALQFVGFPKYYYELARYTTSIAENFNFHKLFNIYTILGPRNFEYLWSDCDFDCPCAVGWEKETRKDYFGYEEYVCKRPNVEFYAARMIFKYASSTEILNISQNFLQSFARNFRKKNE